MKRMIWVTSPPACGKTYISKKLADRLRHVVYLDKDTLIPLSKQIFEAANEPYNRSSEFFERHVRNYEYEAIVNLGLEALLYDDIVLINAPFTREIRDNRNMNAFRERLNEYNAVLTVIWVVTSVEVCRERMAQRNSDRDTWKLENWDEYIKTVDFSVPTALNDPNIKDDLLLFYNSTTEEYEQSMTRILESLEP